MTAAKTKIAKIIRDKAEDVFMGGDVYRMDHDAFANLINWTLAEEPTLRFMDPDELVLFMLFAAAAIETDGVNPEFEFTA